MPDHPKLLAPEAVGITASIPYIDALTSTDKSNVYGYAHHLYGGGNKASFAASYGYKPLLQTEYSEGASTFADAMSLATLMHECLTVEDVAAYLYWPLFWEQPNGLVSFPSYGSSNYTINPVYYAFKQHSAFTDPNWQRVDASTNSSNLKISAYISPDNNQMSAVIINTSSSTDIALNLTFYNVTVIDGDVYRTSQTENCVLVDPFEKSEPLTLP
ncbi:unnamed protein product, partial [marine sediment metagenome]